MTIELTPAQYETLLKLVYLGEWMSNGIRIEEERDGRTAQAAQYFYSYASEAGASTLIEYDAQGREYIPTRELEEDTDVTRFRDEYDAEVFWDELVERLSMRDMMQMYGDQQWAGGTLSQQTEQQRQYSEKYAVEFEQNGVENLVLKG